MFSCKQERIKSPEELKMELKAQEDQNPTQYLKLNSVKLNRNKIKEAGFFSSAKYDGFLINGNVLNSATIAKYKDLTLTVEFFSKTNTLLDSKNYTIFEYYEPNSSKDFQLKVYPPNSMANYNVTIFGANNTY
jgi:predicted component of type VI protein secretion system